jgi:acetyl-CoA carboxylase biotin carboxyl carrier protein
MKLFNEIEAGITGEIVEVLCKDGEFVEYGQPLFLVKPE